MEKMRLNLWLGQHQFSEPSLHYAMENDFDGLEVDTEYMPRQLIYFDYLAIKIRYFRSLSVKRQRRKNQEHEVLRVSEGRGEYLTEECCEIEEAKKLRCFIGEGEGEDVSQAKVKVQAGVSNPNKNLGVKMLIGECKAKR